MCMCVCMCVCVYVLEYKEWEKGEAGNWKGKKEVMLRVRSMTVIDRSIEPGPACQLPFNPPSQDSMHTDRSLMHRIHTFLFSLIDLSSWSRLALVNMHTFYTVHACWYESEVLSSGLRLSYGCVLTRQYDTQTQWRSEWRIGSRDSAIRQERSEGGHSLWQQTLFLQNIMIAENDKITF